MERGKGKGRRDARTALRVLSLSFLLPLAVAGQSGVVFISYADVRPLFEVLRSNLLPPPLRDLAPDAREARWSAWVSERDAAIRARVIEGDEDSIINLLQFGTSFTRQPRITEQQLAGVVMRKAGSPDVFVPSPVLQGRMDDFIAALAAPGANERLQFARRVIDHHGFEPATADGRARLRRYLEERTAAVGIAPHAAALHDPATDLADQRTIFRDRGLASDTLLWVNFALDETLRQMTAAGVLRPGAIRRVAIVGPGLDFADKQEGYDFYPPQTIQPFALLDSLVRARLATPGDVMVTAFDLSPVVLEHLQAARTRAAAGQAYTVVLPRNLDQPWTAALVEYRSRLGDQIGTPAAAVTPPGNAGRVEARSVAFPASIVERIVPRDLDIVLQRLTPGADADRFDLVVATNVLLYYDVFEQALAAANIAAMLRPGGFLLSNDRMFELPGAPLATAGGTEVAYMNVPGSGPRGDRIEWYQSRARP